VPASAVGVCAPCLRRPVGQDPCGTARDRARRKRVALPGDGCQAARVSENEPRTSSDVSALFDARGRLIAIPRKAARRQQLLVHLAHTLFEPGRSYSEREVNDALRTVHEDYPALRRYLIEARLLARTRDGGSYHRV
jgi:hypothetical protein